jgi:transmembrane sensor
VEGRVAVWGPLELPSGTAESPAPIAQLDAGQQARIGRASAEVSKKAEDVRKTVAWLQRQVVFDHDPLASAVAEFNRYSETSIRIDDERLGTTEVSGIFSAYDTEAFIRFLEHQPDMRVQRGDREIIVTPAIVK